VELFVGVFEVLAYGRRRDAERGGDLRVGVPMDEVVEDLAFARSQPQLIVRA
jgi:hypothetical protein